MALSQDNKAEVATRQVQLSCSILALARGASTVYILLILEHYPLAGLPSHVPLWPGDYTELYKRTLPPSYVDSLWLDRGVAANALLMSGGGRPSFKISKDRYTNGKHTGQKTVHKGYGRTKAGTRTAHVDKKTAHV